MTRSRVLVLAGTSEARDLVSQLVTQGIDVVASLAGVTSAPLSYACLVRRGGFGGPKGLAEWMHSEKITALVDATHPFAARMPWNAAQAAELTGVPLLHLKRPEWSAKSEINWRNVPCIESAAAILPGGARAFLATGRSSAKVFAARRDVRFVLRVIDMPDPLVPGFTGEYLVARPPFSERAESDLFRAKGITHLVTKNSGGHAGRSKLRAASELGIEVVMVARPLLPPGNDRAEDVAGAIAWVRQQPGIDSGENTVA